MSDHHSSTRGRRQDRRGPLDSSVLPGHGVTTARAESIISARRAAAELAAHRRRLLEFLAETEDRNSTSLSTPGQLGGQAGGKPLTVGLESRGADSTDAILLHLDATKHSAGLGDLAAAAFGFPTELPADIPQPPLADLPASSEASDQAEVTGITAAVPYRLADGGATNLQSASPAATPRRDGPDQKSSRLLSGSVAHWPAGNSAGITTQGEEI